VAAFTVRTAFVAVSPVAEKVKVTLPALVSARSE